MIVNLLGRIRFCINKLTVFVCDRNTPKVTAAGLAGLIVLPISSAFADVPPSIAAPSDAQVIASMAAAGVQIYTCKADASDHLEWVFKEPSATLYDDTGQEAVHHSAGPQWRALDGSTIIGTVRAKAPSEEQNSVPQLLLDAKSTAGPGILSSVRYIQRVETKGGEAPAVPCKRANEIGRSPYFARYLFLK